MTARIAHRPDQFRSLDPFDCREPGRCTVVVVSRLNPVRFDSGDMPSSAGVERRFQLFLTDGVRASIGTIVTLGPWDAPRRFVAVGPSRWVCNPNYIGALLVVFGEARLFLSLPLIVCAVFAVSLFSVGVGRDQRRHQSPDHQRAQRGWCAVPRTSACDG